MALHFDEDDFDAWLSQASSLKVPLACGHGWCGHRLLDDGRHYLLLARAPLEDGMQVVYGEFRPDQQVKVHLAPAADLLLTFFVQGDIAGFDGSPGRQVLPFGPHSVLLRSANPRWGSTVQIPAGVLGRFLQVRLSPAVFRAWAARLALGLPDSFLRQLDRRDGATLWRGPWSANVYAALAPWRSAALLQRALVPFVRAKAQELLTLFLVELSARGPAASPAPRLAVDRLATARALLLADPARDWTVRLIAQELRCSPSALKVSFAAAGMTPAGMLRELRLARARELLRESGLPVFQVALQVGYTCPSRFSALYRRRFGNSPSSEAAACARAA